MPVILMTQKTSRSYSPLYESQSSISRPSYADRYNSPRLISISFTNPPKMVMSPGSYLLMLSPSPYRRSICRHVNLANATPEELEQLTQFCEHTSTDHSKEEVTDETRRKRRKIESNGFSPFLVPQLTDLIKIVRNYLLEGTDSTRQIDIELYELNVYSASDPPLLLADTKLLPR
jgi:hypothetical protein